MLKVILVLLISISPVFSGEDSYSDKLRKSVFGVQKTKEELYQARRYAVLAPLLKESQLEQAAQLEQQEQLRQQEQLEQKRQLELQAQFEQKTKQQQLQLLEDAVRLFLPQPGLSEIGMRKINDLSEDNRDIIIQTARLYKTRLFEAQHLFEEQHLIDLLDNIQRIKANREKVITNLLVLLEKMPSLSSENRIVLINTIIWNGSGPERIIDVTQQALRLVTVGIQYRSLLAIIKDILTKPDKRVIVDYLIKLIDRCPDLLGSDSRNCGRLLKVIITVASADRPDVMAHVLRLAMPDVLTSDLISLILKIQVTPKEQRDALVTATEKTVIPIIVQQ